MFIALISLLSDTIAEIDLPDLLVHPEMKFIGYENYTHGQNWFDRLVSPEDIDTANVNLILRYNFTLSPINLIDFYAFVTAANPLYEFGWNRMPLSRSEVGWPSFISIFWKPKPNRLMFVWLEEGENFTIVKIAYLNLLPISEDVKIPPEYLHPGPGPLAPPPLEMKIEPEVETPIRYITAVVEFKNGIYLVGGNITPLAQYTSYLKEYLLHPQKLLKLFMRM